MVTSDPREHLPLSAAQFHILVSLTAGEMHGYAIMQAIERSSDGVVKIGPASLYGTLKKLVEVGLAEEVAPPKKAEDARRRYYRLTALGARVCSAEAERLAALVAFSRAHLRPGTV